jgi:hypothetical protein
MGQLDDVQNGAITRLVCDKSGIRSSHLGKTGRHQTGAQVSIVRKSDQRSGKRTVGRAKEIISIPDCGFEQTPILTLNQMLRLKKAPT